MKKLFSNGRRSFTLFLLLTFLIVQGVNAQRKVSGKVFDTLKEPLIGASVVVKGTTTGVMTDIDGAFSIVLPQGKNVLSISYVGYKTKDVSVKDNSFLQIELDSDAQNIDEVVVVGYGTQKKTSLTGSVAQVGSKEILQAPAANLSTVLGGRLPGLVTKQSSGVPGGDDATMLVRGVSTTGKTEPMIIVDGVPRSFNQLDPNEIESITILKDASAAAVYGLQAANGVILVTTRRGSEGKASVSYNGSVSMNTNTRFPQFLDGPSYAWYHNKAREMDGLDPLFTKDDVRKMVNGDPDGKFGNTNWVDEIFKTGWTNHHNVSVNGGTKDIKYFFTVGYYNQQGNVDKFDFQRFNVRGNIDATIAKSLTVSLDLAARKEDRSAPTFGVGKNDYLSIVQQAIRAHPYLPKYYDGLPVGSPTASVAVNPLAARDLSGSNDSELSVFQSNLSAKWDLPWVKGLSLKGMVSYDHDYTYSKIFKTPYDLNNASVANMSSMGLVYNKAVCPAISEVNLTEGMARASRLTAQASLSYARTFGKHDVTGLFLFEQSNRLSNKFQVTGRDFNLPDLPELDHATAIGAGKGFSGSSLSTPRAGFVFRGTYAYDSKYLLDVSGRYDGSYKFAKDKRWSLFPAVSLGWRISSEEFMEKYDFIDNLKIRASAGKLGSDANVNAFSYLRYVDWVNKNPVVVINGDPMQALMTSSVANPDLTWETNTTYNIGADMMLWNGKLGVEFDWFYKITKDILRSQSGLFPPSLGNNFPPIINAGKVDNRGFELVLSHNNRIGKVNFGARFNLNWSRNRILNIDESPNIPDYLKRNGRSVGEKDGFIADGLFQTMDEVLNSAVVLNSTLPGDIRYRDLNGDGKITYDQDRTWIGRSSTPELMGGLNLTADWNGFDMSVLFQGAALCDVALMGFYENVGWDNTEFTRTFYHGGNSPLYLVENSWTPENPNAKYPRLSTVSRPNGYANTMWMINGSYLRLKNLQIGYTLPKQLTSKLSISQVRVYLAGTNLFTLSHNPFLDPEAPDVANGYYPQQRSYTFGLNLTF